MAKKTTGALATIRRRCCSASVNIGAGLGWTLRTLLGLGWFDEGFTRPGCVSLAQSAVKPRVTLVTRARFVNGKQGCALDRVPIIFA
jgi:hypothetical protein